jgi:hypothetical protein
MSENRNGGSIMRVSFLAAIVGVAVALPASAQISFGSTRASGTVSQNITGTSQLYPHATATSFSTDPLTIGDAVSGVGSVSSGQASVSGGVTLSDLYHGTLSFTGQSSVINEYAQYSALAWSEGLLMYIFTADSAFSVSFFSRFNAVGTSSAYVELFNQTTQHEDYKYLLDGNGSATYGSSLLAPGTYTLYMKMQETADLTQTAGTTSSLVSGTTSFVITAGAVPEPATWATMIGGLGLVGATMRRRRRHGAGQGMGFAAL